MEDLIDKICNLDERAFTKFKPLLEKILNINSPMNFTEDFASEEELEELINEMYNDNLNTIIVKKFLYTIEQLQPTKSFNKVFI